MCSNLAVSKPVYHLSSSERRQVREGGRKSRNTLLALPNARGEERSDGRARTMLLLVEEHSAVNATKESNNQTTKAEQSKARSKGEWDKERYSDAHASVAALLLARTPGN